MTLNETVGLALTDARVPTPAFVIDDEKLAANLERAKQKARALGITLRPISKRISRLPLPVGRWSLRAVRQRYRRCSKRV
ncbi:hypothetical protein EVA_08785, partial [gut metagenome]